MDEERTDPAGSTSASRARRGAETVPDRVGPFRVLGVLGSGGMGTVYLAEQEEPVQRQVALKVLASGRRTARGIARMEAERQALALMNHPSIATVYHAGATDDGFPFFAMEVVRGLPLIEYCDRERLGLRERLVLFVQICEAVQHAHLKMVIHRDLKPSNVLVTMEEGRPVPKLIDFGIAKCLERPLTTNASLTTREGLPVGTPLYMSPEQIAGDLVDLDARVDVYALGILLYELLAGVQPFDVSESEAIQVMMRVLKEEMPRPSVRFAELPAAVAQKIVGARRMDEASMVKELRGDLDWIIMKAIDKERCRRYGSAADLRAEVQRYLANEPVQARPPSAAYRARRFVRRQKILVAAGGIVLIALTAGLTVSSVATLRATEARDQALAAERRATATVSYLRKVLSSVDPGVDGRQVRVVDLLTKASEMIGSDLANEPEVEAAVRKTIGLTLLELGIFEESASQLERTVDLQEGLLGPGDPETLHSVNSVGRLLYKLGRYDRAALIHAKVYEEQKRLLGPEADRTLWTMYHLAKALDKNGSWQEAERLYRENVAIRSRVLGAEHPDTLVTLNSMSLFLATSGQLAEAETMQRKTIDALSRNVGPEHPDTLRGRANLMEICNLQGRFAEAEEVAREHLEYLSSVLGPEHPETLGMSAQLAVALDGQARYGDAEALNRRVLALRRSRVGPSHPDSLATAVALAGNLASMGAELEAEQLYRQTLAVARESLPESSWRVALMEQRFGAWLVQRGELAEAEELLLSAHGALSQLNHPAARQAAESLAELYRVSGRQAEASHYGSLAKGG